MNTKQNDEGSLINQSNFAISESAPTMLVDQVPKSKLGRTSVAVIEVVLSAVCMFSCLSVIQLQSNVFRAVLIAVMTCKLIGAVAICMVVRQRYLRYLQHLAHLLNPKTTLVAFTVSSLEAVIQGLISDLECEEALQVQSWLLALTRRVQLQELVMPLLYFTGFASRLNEEDFSEHLTQGAAVEGTTSIVVGIVMLVRLFTGPEVST